MNKDEPILIIGAGLCGSLLALRMAQRGFNVKLVERRPDLRKVEQDAGKSINLAFSDRGMKGIALVGLQDEVKKLCIPMHGRMIHDTQGNTFLSPYSGRENEYINSISRPGLNMLLIDAAEALPNVSINFNMSCDYVDLEKGLAVCTDNESKQETKLSGQVIFGTDGAGSRVRKSMSRHRKFLFNFSQQWLTHGYKELTIPAGPNGDYLTDKGALHIWPRGEDMLIALPNLDGSFTVTLFLPYDNSDYCFNNLTSVERVKDYFNQEFPDVVTLMPNLTTEFFNNPTGPLGTIKCSPWSANGKTLLMGDAAHAIVPFYGQGMNASFEDVVEFDAFLDTHTGDWQQIFEAYQAHRKKDTDAIADLAVDNFHEMKEHTANALFQEKRKLEMAFESNYPNDYYSKYSMVTFKASMSYHEAMKIGRAQDKAILNLLNDGHLPEEMPLEKKLALVKKETQKMLNAANILGD